MRSRSMECLWINWVVGIGRGLVAHYLAQPDNIVVGTVRDVLSEQARDLSSLPNGPDSSLITVPLNADNPLSAAQAASELQVQHGIKHVDIIIANAGFCNHWWPSTGDGRLGRAFSLRSKHAGAAQAVQSYGTVTTEGQYSKVCLHLHPPGEHP